MKRSTLIFKLNGYNYSEIEQAREILTEFTDAHVNIKDLRLIWDRVSVAIDHHVDDDNPLTGLLSLENELSEVVSYQIHGTLE